MQTPTMTPTDAAGARVPYSLASYCLVIALGAVAVLRAFRNTDLFNMTYWTFTYDYGFTKRALVGEIVARVVGPPSGLFIQTASVVLFLLATGGLAALFIAPAVRERFRTGALLFALVAVTHSATLPHLAYDLGRFDQIGYILLIAGLGILRWSPRWIRPIAITAICVVGILIHEAFFFFGALLIIAIWAYEDGFQRMVSYIAVLLLVAATAALTQNAALTGRVAVEDYVEVLQQRHTFPIVYESVSGGLFSNIPDRLAWNIKFLRFPSQLAHHSILLLSMLPTFVLLLSIGTRFRTGERTLRDRRLLLLLAALAPLALYLVATDFYRWWSIALTNVFLVTSYVAMREDRTEELASAVERRPILSIAVLGLSLSLGPLGIENSYPLFQGLHLLPSSWSWPP